MLVDVGHSRFGGVTMGASAKNAQESRNLGMTMTAVAGQKRRFQVAVAVVL